MRTWLVGDQVVKEWTGYQPSWSRLSKMMGINGVPIIRKIPAHGPKHCRVCCWDSGSLNIRNRPVKTFWLWFEVNKVSLVSLPDLEWLEELRDVVGRGRKTGEAPRRMAKLHCLMFTPVWEGLSHVLVSYQVFVCYTLPVCCRYRYFRCIFWQSVGTWRPMDRLSSLDMYRQRLALQSHNYLDYVS